MLTICLTVSTSIFNCIQIHRAVVVMLCFVCLYELTTREYTALTIFGRTAIDSSYATRFDFSHSQRQIVTLRIEAYWNR